MSGNKGSFGLRTKLDMWLEERSTVPPERAVGAHSNAISEFCVVLLCEDSRRLSALLEPL